MKICVLGLWHLGTVISACLAAGGHEVRGLDFDAPTIRHLQWGEPPLFEPGLAELIRKGLSEGRLSFSLDPGESLSEAEVVWVAYDTPVDDEDRADVEYVLERVTRIFPHLPPEALILISSQLPVGTTRRLEELYAKAFPERTPIFGYSPENLRLGKAIQAFSQADRVVVGLRSSRARDRVEKLFLPFSSRIEWMSVESAEMTKHALNAFLAASVTFINELASLCEHTGADAREVERGLKSESRIGPRAYLTPGGAFAGGTLARDVNFLIALGARHRLPVPLMSAVAVSNEAHKSWSRRKIKEIFPNLRNIKAAVWGLTYKPGTSTLRRSSALEMCLWMAEQGMQVQAHDPAVRELPPEFIGKVKLFSTPLSALEGAKALVVATEWPDYLSFSAEEILAAMAGQPLILDPNRFLAKTLSGNPDIQYVTVGAPALPFGKANS